MIKHLITLFFVGLLFLFFPSQSNAHIGSGPPFLKIDGKNADTNPYYQGDSTIMHSWDMPPESYLVNKPITFTIDVAELLRATTVSQEFAKDIKIRWSIASGDNFENRDTQYEEGQQLTKTFTNLGSYLIIIEAKLPADSEYILINTVQVDILPSKNYQIPHASVYVGTQKDDPSKQVLMVSQSSVDPSAKVKKYLWETGNGKLGEGASFKHRFETLNEVGIENVFHRVVDSNGFIADVGFLAENRNGQLQFLPFGNRPTLPVIIGTYEEAATKTGNSPTKLPIPVFLGISLGVLIVIGAGWIWVFKKKKKR